MRYLVVNIFHVFYMTMWLHLTLRIEGALRNNEILLTEFLLSNYSKQARPVINPKDAINATFGIEIVQFIKVDDRNQMLTTKVYVRQSWKNFLLPWNSSDWKGVKEVQLDADLVWVPDVVLYNNADDQFPGGTEKYKTHAMLYENGDMYWLSPATFISTCSIDIKYFPFDQQTCHLKFGSWTFDMAAIDLHLDDRPMITQHYTMSSEWDLVRVEKVRNVILYACCPKPFADVTFKVVLLRKPLYYVFNVITPCLVLVSTILFGFFLPPESGERISLTITILLAIAVFLQLISDSLPRNSDSIPILAIFYMVIMAESAISLVTTCVVLVIHYRSSDKATAIMPQWVRKMFLVHCANLLGVKSSSVVTVAEQNNDGEFNAHQPKDFSAIDNYAFRLNDDVIGQPFERKDSGETKTFEGALHSILKEVKFITSNMVDKQRSEEHQEEWKFLAKVLDRLFFWLFLFTVITSTTCILVPVYLIHHH